MKAILIIIAGVVVVAAIASSGEKTGQQATDPTGPDAERIAKVTCDRYIVAVQQKATQCINQGYRVDADWFSIKGYEAAQMRSCMMTNYSWKQSGAKTDDCTRAVLRTDCTRFNGAPWLSGPPCN